MVPQTKMSARRAGTSWLAVLIAVLMLGVVASPAASAPVPQIDADAEASLVIHKMAQPQEFGVPAPGVRQDVSDLEPIGGVSFTVTRVPGVDLTTNDGWEQVNQLSPAEARQLTAEESAHASGTTDSNGELEINGLAVGLYVVEETSAPAGTLSSSPFLVTLPHPHQGAWLYTVHAYPKNAVIGTEITVNDADTVTDQDPVGWTSRSDIPRLEDIGRYRVDHQLDPGLQLLGTADDVSVAVDCLDCSVVLAPSDYTLNLDTGEDRDRITITFTATGLEKLAQARAEDPEAQVMVRFQTRARGTGEAANAEFTNDVELVTEDAATGTASEPVTDSATTKFGPLTLLVHEVDHPEQPIAGARFRVYLTAEDALADQNPITIDGQSEWTTDQQGTIELDRLRFSNFVNGLDREPGDPLHRSYFAIMTYIPPGWEGAPGVLSAEVVSSSEPAVLVEELWRSGEAGPDDPAPTDLPENGTDDPAPGTDPADSSTMPADEGAEGEREADLPVTGAQIAGLIILSVLLIVGGVIIRARRTVTNEDSGH